MLYSKLVEIEFEELLSQFTVTVEGVKSKLTSWGKLQERSVEKDMSEYDEHPFSSYETI